MLRNTLQQLIHCPGLLPVDSLLDHAPYSIVHRDYILTVGCQSDEGVKFGVSRVSSSAVSRTWWGGAETN